MPSASPVRFDPGFGVGDEGFHAGVHSSRIGSALVEAGTVVCIHTSVKSILDQTGEMFRKDARMDQPIIC